jgi:hypothetical protein
MVELACRTAASEELVLRYAPLISISEMVDGHELQDKLRVVFTIMSTYNHDVLLEQITALIGDASATTCHNGAHSRRMTVDQASLIQVVPCCACSSLSGVTDTSLSQSTQEVPQCTYAHSESWRVTGALRSVVKEIQKIRKRKAKAKQKAQAIQETQIAGKRLARPGEIAGLTKVICQAWLGMSY